MNVLQGLEGLRQLPPGTVACIGNFDGVHRGHQHLLGLANHLKGTAPGTAVAAITFEPHPLTVLRPGQAPPRLTPPAYKRQLLKDLGVDWLVELAPLPQVLDLTAEQFWQIIRDQVRPSHLVEGRSFSFGKGRGGTIDKLVDWTAMSNVRLHVLDPITVPLMDLLQVPVSSSVIRWLLEQGRVRDAAICLGRPYLLEGLVVRGAGRGKDLGYPTANLQCQDQMVPADGVYAGRVQMDGEVWPAAVSIGTNPTFGSGPRTVEAYLIGFCGELYQKTIRLEFIDWLREQRTFSSVDSLKRQIARDVEESEARAELSPQRPNASDALAVMGQEGQRLLAVPSTAIGPA